MEREASPAPDARRDDAAFLDDLFDRVLADLAEGQPLDPAQLLGERGHLRAELDGLISLAREVAIGDEPPPRRIGGYRIEGELGAGAMGEVYLARQEGLERSVALKVLPHSCMFSRSARRRFLAEARALARIRHPHVVPVYDVVEEDEVYAYAMEAVDGCTLAQVVERLGGLPREPHLEDLRHALTAPPEALQEPNLVVYFCRLGISIARALGAVHRAGLLHRDVKPSNIMLRRDGSALLTDFGLVHDEESALHSRTGRFVGTPAYAAPEQLRAQGDVDPRTDVYSLGVTLYQALSHRLPFTGGSTAALLMSIEAGQALPLRRVRPGLPRDLETIVAKAMDAEPERRYGDADQLADDLERLLALQPIQARRRSPLVRALKFGRRNRPTLVTGGAVAALVALAAYGLFGYLQYRAGIPAEVERLLAEARLTLVHPGWGEVAHQVAHGLEPPKNREFLPADIASRAAADYERALELDPSRLTPRLELETLRVVRALSDGAPLPAQTRLESDCPATWRAAQAVAESRRPDFAAVVGSGPLPAEDRRCLGLFGFLRGDGDLCLEAWEGFDLASPPDPLVDAALGECHLSGLRPALAYPRLLRAAEAFPRAGFLGVDLADAAVQVGDLPAAERFLARARALPGLDPFGSLERVSGDLRAARGDPQGALSWYEQGLATSPSPTLIRRHAALLGKFGLPAGGLRERPELIELWRHEALDLMTVAVEGWWSERTFAERVGQLELELVQPGRGAALLFELIAGIQTATAPPSSAVGLRRLEVGLALIDPRGPDRGALPATLRRGLCALALLCDAAPEGPPFDAARWLLRRALLPKPPPTRTWGSPRAPLLYLERGPPGARLASQLAAVGDTDGDGLGDYLLRLELGSPAAPDSAVQLRSGRDHRVLRTWPSELPHLRPTATMAGPGDLDRDGFPDLALTSHGPLGGELPGLVVAYSGRDGTELWRVEGREPGARFGAALCGPGDLDGNGWPDLAVIASTPGQLVALGGRDGARLFELALPPALRAPTALVGAGDQDGDGWPDLAVGHPFDPSAGPQFGSVRLLAARGGAELHRILGYGSARSFGTRLLGVGDLDGDGRGEVLVGVSRDHRRGSQSGSVLAWSPARGTPLWRVAGDASVARLGCALELLPDLDGDGLPEILAGVSETVYRSGEPGDGRVRVLAGRTGATLFDLIAPAGAGGIGSSLCCPGDLDGDGRPEVALGGQLQGAGTAAAGQLAVVSLLPPGSADDRSGD